LIYRPDERYPINWNHRRQAVFKAVGYICQMCGVYAKGEMHYHHIRPIGCGGTHAPSNMVPICKRCHDFIHSGNYDGPFLDLSNCRKRR
jgi:5-methylcytosine-specific restriction endonuclease McrA